MMNRAFFFSLSLPLFASTAAIGCGALVDEDKPGPDPSGTGTGTGQGDGGPGQSDASLDGSSTSEAGGGGAGVCATDPDCNDDPKMSAIAGTCFHGICVCNFSFYVQTSGKCGSTPPVCGPLGTCHQEPAECPAGTMRSNETTNMSCGDFVAAVCCYDTATCKGPDIDFECLRIASQQRGDQEEPSARAHHDTFNML